MATIEIPTPDAVDVGAEIAFTLKSVTPLLMNRPGAMTANTGEVKRTNERRIPTPEEECANAAYQFEDGVLYIPSRWVTRSLIEAGKQFQNPNNKRQTLMRTFAAAVIPPPAIGFALRNPETGDPITEFEIDIQRCVVKATSGAVMRARPRIDEWAAEITLGLDTSVLQGNLEEVGTLMMRALTVAGSKQGFGDFRPEKTGSYGRFTVEGLTISDDS